MATWDETKAEALKILGKDAEVPDPPSNIAKALENYKKSFDKFKKSREDCEAQIETVRNTCDAARNALESFEDKIEKSDFKLDSKKKEDAEKIEKARKLLTGVLNEAIKTWVDGDKTLREVDKHLAQLGKYEQTPAPL